jgi:predicted site-specific integrase-resolvase
VWLPVSEAGKRLEISVTAVRKWMQHGTLMHSKWTNGRVYVYVDDEQDAKKDQSGWGNSGGAPVKSQRSW